MVSADPSASIYDCRIGRIPVRNLWLLMFYASDLFKSASAGQGGIEQAPDDLPDLVAEILCHAVEQRIRQRLTSGFVSRSAVVSRVRGRIDVLQTARHQLLERGKVACRFDELTVNTLRNRLVKAALYVLPGLVKDRKLAHRCRGLADNLRAMGVYGEAPSRAQISTERFGRNDAQDKIMVEAAKLALDLVLPTESGTTDMFSPDREGTWVRNLFERAVGGFYTVALIPKGWKVKCGTYLGWQISHRTEGIPAILPGMKTDVTLDDPSVPRRLIIDTKFTTIVTSGWRRDETLRSGYIYQMYAYLRSQAGNGDPLAEHASGLLLHPSVGEMVDETVVIQGHALRFATVDLMASASDIRNQLLNLCSASHPAQ